MTPRIQYAKTSDGVNIAHYALGEGPPLVYLTPGSHLEREWQYPEQRSWLERLAAHHRLVRFDGRGTGLSDRGGDWDVTLELLPRDIDAVVRKEGVHRFALMGQLSSSAIALLYAAEHPDRVSHLVLWCPYASPRDVVESSPPLQAVRAAASKDWRTLRSFSACW